MKKLFMYIIMFVCCMLCFGLFGCIVNVNDSSHNHKYKIDWKSDDKYHWHECEEETCMETSHKEEHVEEEGVCIICNHKLYNFNYEVNEEEYYNAISLVGVTSLTIQEENNGTFVNGVWQGIVRVKYLIDGNKFKKESVDKNIYYEKLGEETFVYSYNEKKGVWIKNKATEVVKEFFGFSKLLSGLKYSDFVFENGYYLMEIVGEGGSINAKLQFKNKKLSYVDLRSYDGTERYQTVVFSNYEKTNINLPTDYKDNKPVPTSRETWASYFVFENVTINKTHESLTTSNLWEKKESLKIYGGTWLWQKSNCFYRGITYSNFNVYFDGINAYANRVVDNAMSLLKQTIIACADFSSYQSQFTEKDVSIFKENELWVGEEILYTSKQIKVNDNYSYNDIEIRVTKGKISTIEYTKESLRTTNSEKVLLSFSSWGETTIEVGLLATPSLWNSFFDFDNVTINQSSFYDMNGETKQRFGNEWKINGEQWECRRAMMTGANGEVLKWDVAYFDGENSYVNGEHIDDITSYHYGAMWVDIIDELHAYETMFTEKNIEGQKIYSAEKISINNNDYANIKIVIENGKIVTIEYDILTYSFDGNPEKYLVSFYDYGNTNIDAQLYEK